MSVVMNPGSTGATPVIEACATNSARSTGTSPSHGIGAASGRLRPSLVLDPLRLRIADGEEDEYPG